MSNKNKVSTEDWGRDPNSAILVSVDNNGLAHYKARRVR